MPGFDSKFSPLVESRQELSIANPAAAADDASSQASDESSLGIALDEAQKHQKHQKPVAPTIGSTGLLRI